MLLNFNLIVKTDTVKKNMFAKYLLTTCLLLISSWVVASDLNHPLTLVELVDIALENNPSTRQTWWNANRAASALGNAKSAYYPKIGLEANIKNGRDFKFINGPDADYTIVGADLLLSLLLYDFGERRANIQAAKMSLLAANWQVDWNIQKVMIKVLENAYSTLHTQEVLLAARSSLEDAEKVLEAARELNRAGLTPVSDVYTTQATFSQMKMEVTHQKAQLAIQKGKLASSLGLSANVPLEMADLNAIQSPSNAQIDELTAIALRQRADLMAKQAQLSESLSILDKTRASYGPKVTLSGRAGANHALHDKASGAQYQIALNFEMPLFNGFETMYKNRMAYADTKISMEELAQLQLDISLEVLTSSFSLEAATQMLPDAEDNLKNSLKAYESVLEKYRAGKERIAEVSNAQRQLSAARVKYSDVKTRWLTSIANLAYATGTLAPYMETP